MTTFNQKYGTVTGNPNAFDVLIADYSQDSGLPNGIHLGYQGGQDIKNRSDGQAILSFSDIDAFVVTGTQSNDILSGGNNDDILAGVGGNDFLYGNGGNDYLSGGDGNDYLEGGDGVDQIFGGNGSDTLVGGAGDTLIDDNRFDGSPDTFIAAEAAFVRGDTSDTLISDYSTKDYHGGIHFGLYNSADGTVHVSDSSGNYLLNFNGSLVNYKVTGTQYDDIFDANYAYSATFNGGAGNDELNGGTGDDILKGGVGNDKLNGDNGNDDLSGGDGNDIISGGDGNDTINGDNGDDILSAGRGFDTSNGGAGNDVIYGVAGINGETKHLAGGDGSDTFVLDLSGDINLSFNMNVNTLGNFLKDATLPANSGPDFQKIGIDAAFDVVGFAAGFVPVGGPALSFLTALGKTGYDLYADNQAQQDAIKAQAGQILGAVQQYGNANWGNITSPSRDTLIIDDFELGKDVINLPKLGSSSDFYTLQFASNGTQKGVYIYVDHAQAGGFSHQKVAFIANNYGENGGISDAKFQSTIQNLWDHQHIGKFNTTVVNLDNASHVYDISNSDVSFGNDVVQTGDVIQTDTDGWKAWGYYGDDVINGGNGKDTLNGGGQVSTSSTVNQNLDKIYQTDGDDFISGGAGDDTLYGGSGNDYLDGDSKDINTGAFITTGNDYLYGGSGDDRLEGGNGDDELHGDDGTGTSADGDDNLSGGDGVDKLYGGLGNDTLDGGSGNDNLLGDDGNDRLQGGDGTDFLDGGNGDDVLLGQAGDDTLNGQNGNDVLVGDGGNGVGGNDIMVGAAGNDQLYGQEGNDHLYGGAGNDTLQGGIGDDLLSDTEGTISGGDGIDTLQADYSAMGYGVNHDAGVHLGTIGSVSAVFGRNDGAAILNFDTVELFNVTGTNFNDHLEGAGGNDKLTGGGGDDELLGKAGNDVINGGSGADDMYGGLGNDTYYVDNTADIITEAAGGGTDTAFSTISTTLGSFLENLTLTGVTALNGTGNTLNNVMVGNNAANTLNGLAGNDNLNGNAGNDVLNGGYGNDVLNGGLGNDVLTGGAGSDKFKFSAAGTANIDKISDFSVPDDTIVLDHVLFSKLTVASGVSADNFYTVGVGTQTANDYLVYNATTGALSYDSNGNVAGGAVQFATLDVVGTAHPALTAADFLIV